MKKTLEGRSQTFEHDVWDVSHRSTVELKKNSLHKNPDQQARSDGDNEVYFWDIIILPNLSSRLLQRGLRGAKLAIAPVKDPRYQARVE